MVPMVSTLQELLLLRNHEEGEIIYVGELKQNYHYHNGEWLPYEENSEDPGVAQMNLYNFNQMIMAQVPEVDEAGIENIKKLIKDFIGEANNAYMLLCHELRYYTLFLKDSAHVEEKLEDVMIECLKSLGKIKDVFVTEDENAIECWIQQEGEDIANVLYFFNYNDGVVLCH